jgi:hypothetical protein
MKKATEVLSSLSAEVTADGVAVESSAARHLFKPNQVRKILLFRSPFSKTVAYVGLELDGRVVVVPPLQDNMAFVNDLRSVMPQVQQVEKRRLLHVLV